MKSICLFFTCIYIRANTPKYLHEKSYLFPLSPPGLEKGLCPIVGLVMGE